ncbi:MAG: hypothetical protein AAGI23_11960, partial [Bacteroidota bacterium]
PFCSLIYQMIQFFSDMSMVFVSSRRAIHFGIAPKRIKRSRNGKLLRQTCPFAIRHLSKTCSTLAPYDNYCLSYF